jgi:hypothetical protein
VSDLSKFLKGKFGVPEVNLAQNPATAPVVNAFSVDAIREVLKSATEEDVRLTIMLGEMELKRREQQKGQQA